MTLYTFGKEEWLELNLFEDIEGAQLLATQWKWTYSNVRPHSARVGVKTRPTTPIPTLFPML